MNKKDTLIFFIFSLVTVNIINLVYIGEHKEYPTCNYSVSPKEWMIISAVISILFVILLFFILILEISTCKCEIQIRIIGKIVIICGLSLLCWLCFGFYIFVNKCSIIDYPKIIISTCVINIGIYILYFLIILISYIRCCKDFFISDTNNNNKNNKN